MSIFGAAAEAFVFAYIGLCVFTYTDSDDAQKGDYQWSWPFICWMCGIIIVGRLFAVWTAHFLFKLCSKKRDITLRELGFISYGGMIRGAIAFGLVLKIPDDKEGGGFRERGLVVTTTLAAVIFTTVAFGSFMPVVQKILVPPDIDQKVMYDVEDEDETEEEKVD